jgi:hypothetical protein
MISLRAYDSGDSEIASRRGGRAHDARRGADYLLLWLSVNGDSNGREKRSRKVTLAGLYGRAQSLHPVGASKGAQRELLRCAPSACWQNGG